jgi:hypothetical protein
MFDYSSQGRRISEVNQDIRKAVEVINHRIENLERIKGALLEEFGAGSVLGEMPESSVRPRLLSSGAGDDGNGNGATRRTELAQFFRTHGPATRGEIIAKSGIPKGTIAFLLNKWPEFVRRRKKWQLVEKAGSHEEEQKTAASAD